MLSDDRHKDEGIKAWLDAYHASEPFYSCSNGSSINSVQTKEVDASTNLSTKKCTYMKFGNYAVLTASVSVSSKINEWTQFGFQRGGAIIAAVNIDIHTTRPSELTLLSGMSTSGVVDPNLLTFSSS